VREHAIPHWRVVGFAVVFIALPLGFTAGVVALAIGSPAWSLFAGLGAGGVGALLGVMLIRLPETSRVSGRVSTLSMAAVCFSTQLLTGVPDRILLVPVAFLATMFMVISTSLLLRRQHRPESFRAGRS
jgi:hypothetical protein